MSSLVRVSGAAALALHAAAYLAARGGRRVLARDIARATGASEAHLFKVLGRLERGGIVRGVRGPSGGYELARRPERITLREIYEQIEGPLKTSRCLFGEPVCSGRCMMGSLLAEMDKAVEKCLGGTRLSDVVASFGRPSPNGRKGGRECDSKGA